MAKSKTESSEGISSSPVRGSGHLGQNSVLVRRYRERAELGTHLAGLANNLEVSERKEVMGVDKVLELSQQRTGPVQQQVQPQASVSGRYPQSSLPGA